MTTAPGSSSDTGPTSDDGKTSTTSPLLPTPSGMAGGQTSRGGDRKDEPLLGGIMASLLPTPTAGDGKSSGFRNLPGSGAHPGTSLTDVVRADRLLPTPDAGNFNDGQSIEAWKERGQRMKERHGAEVTMTHGTPLGMVVRLISSSEDSPVSQPAPPAGGREPQTIAGSGPSSPVSLASYDPDSSSWRTFQVSLLSTEDERFPRSWERWPTSGMTRHGRAFALPMSERPTDASVSSSLPTPTKRDYKGRNQRNDASCLPGAVMLHTPTTGDTNPSYDHRASPGYTRAIPVPNLAAQVDELLPTPVSDYSRGLAQPGTDYQSLPNAVLSLGEPTDSPSSDGSE